MVNKKGINIRKRKNEMTVGHRVTYKSFWCFSNSSGSKRSSSVGYLGSTSKIIGTAGWSSWKKKFRRGWANQWTIERESVKDTHGNCFRPLEVRRYNWFHFAARFSDHRFRSVRGYRVFWVILWQCTYLSNTQSERGLTCRKNDFASDILNLEVIVVARDAKFNTDSSRFSDRVGTIKEDSCDGCVYQDQEIGAGLENWLQITRNWGRSNAWFWIRTDERSCITDIISIRLSMFVSGHQDIRASKWIYRVRVWRDTDVVHRLES